MYRKYGLEYYTDSFFGSYFDIHDEFYLYKDILLKGINEDDENGIITFDENELLILDRNIVILERRRKLDGI